MLYYSRSVSLHDHVVAEERSLLCRERILCDAFR
jgi:hypothetical protein